MKKILALFIILFFECYSQKTAILNYSVKPINGTIENSEEVKKTSISNTFVGVDAALAKLDYELLIDNYKTYFHLVSSLDINDKASRLAKSFAGSGEYFTNMQSKETIKKFNLLGQTFNVSYIIDFNWNITGESKNINGFTCYKATQIKTMRLKKTVKEIVAWFCPTIPLNFGPKEFCGLPGLIMELQDDKVVFLVNKINLNPEKSIQINEISGKVITEDEFNKIYDEMLQKTVDELPKKQKN